LAWKFAHGVCGLQRSCHTAAMYYQHTATKSFRKWQKEGLRESHHQPLDNGGWIDDQNSSHEKDELVEIEKYKADAGEAFAQLYVANLHYHGTIIVFDYTENFSKENFFPGHRTVPVVTNTFSQ
jgi:hypothetical protein